MKKQPHHRESAPVIKEDAVKEDAKPIGLRTIFEEPFTTKLPDSGIRRTFATGSVRDSRAGKGRFDLISPIAIKRLAKHYEAGAVKYGDRNWEKGQPLMSYIDSAQRHLNEWMLNKLLGKEDIEDHLAAVIWNAAAFMHTKEMIACGHLSAELDDVPGPTISGS